MSNHLIGSYQVFNDVKQDTKWTCPCCTASVVDKHKMFCWVAKIKEVRVCLPCLSIVSLLDGVKW